MTTRSAVVRAVVGAIALLSALASGCTHVSTETISRDRYSFRVPAGYAGPIERNVDEATVMVFLRDRGKLKSRIEVAPIWIQALNSTEVQLRREARDGIGGLHEGRLRGRKQVSLGQIEDLVVNDVFGTSMKHSFVRDGVLREELIVALRHPNFGLMLVLQEPAGTQQSDAEIFWDMVRSVEMH